MKMTIEEIKKDADATRKRLREKEERALVKFAKLVFQAASSNGSPLPEQEILRVVAEAAARASSASSRFVADLKLPGVENA